MTGQYIITEEQLKAIEKWDTRHLGNEYRSRPLSSALKAERERVLDEYETKLWIELQSCGVSREVMNGIYLNIRSKIESLRSEQP